MLQVARLSPKSLGKDAMELVEAFVRSQQNPDGAFRNRAGESDLYYTVFGLEALIALQALPPAGAVADYLASLGSGEELDFVHLACLARCWASVSPRDLSAVPVEGILAGLSRYR